MESNKTPVISMDERFLETVIEIVESTMGNPHFDTHSLARKVQISR